MKRDKLIITTRKKGCSQYKGDNYAGHFFPLSLSLFDNPQATQECIWIQLISRKYHSLPIKKSGIKASASHNPVCHW